MKFAIVGIGHIGKRHIAVIDAEPNAELVAICDIDLDRCKEQSELYGGIPYYQNYEEMLRDSGCEIVSIATPHGLHAEMAMQAAKHKKHILVEKPMALSVDDSNKMIEVAEQEGVKLYVVKQNRFNIPIKLAKDALDDGKLGKVYMVQCNVMWNRHKEYYSNSDWKGKLDLEGGALHTQASHFLDLLVWWFGELEEAKTVRGTLHHDIEFEDCGVSALRFTSGVIGSLLWSTAVYNKNYEGSITIIGEKGTIKIGGKYLNKIEFWDVQSYPLPEDIEFSDKPNNYGKYKGSSSNHDKLVHELMENFAEKRNGIVEGAEGLKTIRAIDKIYQG
ncbi:MAG: Gfo/Idh/MocA family oxidoreductase [Bacteroidia bacterium]|nr:Gfo/Idh/MocA family oxidoreductase [Bacteroidia bacterium]